MTFFFFFFIISGRHYFSVFMCRCSFFYLLCFASSCMCTRGALSAYINVIQRRFSCIRALDEMKHTTHQRKRHKTIFTRCIYIKRRRIENNMLCICVNDQRDLFCCEISKKEPDPRTKRNGKKKLKQKLYSLFEFPIPDTDEQTNNATKPHNLSLVM